MDFEHCGKDGNACGSNIKENYSRINFGYTEKPLKERISGKES